MQEQTLAILAGGAGTRMGAPKIGLQIGNQSIVRYLAERFVWRGPTMLVLAPGIAAPEDAPANRVVRDPVAGIGPLRGVLTALEHAETEEVVIATVDMPAITAEHLKWVTQQLVDRSDVLGVMCRREIGGVDQIEPFPCAFRRAAASVIEQQLAQQRRSVQGLLKCDGIIALEPRWPAETWVNLNTPDDLQSFVARVSNLCL